MNLEASEIRRNIRDSVVETGPAISRHILLTDRVAPTRGEGRSLTEKSVRTIGTGELTDATEGQSTKVTLQINLRFTTEETATVVDRTVVGIKTVFKNKTHLHAVAEIFRTLQTEAGTRIHAGAHREAVTSIFVGDITVRVLIVKTVVDQAVKRDVGSDRRAGKSADGGHSKQRLLQHFHSLMSRR